MTMTDEERAIALLRDSHQNARALILGMIGNTANPNTADQITSALMKLEEFNNLMRVLVNDKIEQPPIVRQLQQAMTDVLVSVSETITKPMDEAHATEDHLFWLEIRNQYVEHATYAGLAMLGHLTAALTKDPSIGDSVGSPVPATPSYEERRAQLKAAGWVETSPDEWTRGEVDTYNIETGETTYVKPAPNN